MDDEHKFSIFDSWDVEELAYFLRSKKSKKTIKQPTDCTAKTYSSSASFLIPSSKDPKGELSDAIRSKDSKRVEKYINNLSKQPFYASLEDVLRQNISFYTTILFDFFDPKVMDLLFNHINMHSSSLKDNLNSYLCPIQVEYFLDRSKALENFYYDDDPQSSDTIMDCMWVSFFLGLAIYGSESDDERRLLDIILDKSPSIITKALSLPESLGDLLAKAHPQSAWHKSMLDKASMQSWSVFFNNVLSDRFSLKGTSSLSTDTILFLNEYLNENKEVANIWLSSQKQSYNQHIKWQKWYDKYLPKDIPLQNSLFYTTLIKSGYPAHYKSSGANYHPDVSENLGKIIIEDEFDCYLTSSSDSDRSEYDNFGDFLSFNEYLRSGMSNRLESINLVDFVDIQTKRKSAFDSNSPPYIPLTFMHSIIQSSAPVLLDIIKVKSGRDIVERCLNDPYTLHYFLINTDDGAFKKVMGALPSIRDRIDANGNNVAQAFIKRFFCSNKAQAKNFLQVSKQWFLDTNKFGQTLLSLMQEKRLSDVSRASIEKQIIKSSVDNLISLKDKSVKPKNKI